MWISKNPRGGRKDHEDPSEVGIRILKTPEVGVWVLKTLEVGVKVLKILNVCVPVGT